MTTPNASENSALIFGLALVDDRQIELRHRSQARRIAAAEMEALVADCGKAYYHGRKQDRPGDLVTLGQKLYRWLDGAEGWLRSVLGQGTQDLQFDLTQTWEQRSLKPEMEALALQVAHLPWELLHDGMGYLLAEGKISPPARMVVRRDAVVMTPANRPLQMLFMATAPEGVGELKHEDEEANILEATAQQPLLLVTEESGSVVELGNLVQSYGEGYFDVFNLTGHGLIYTQKEYGVWLDRMNPRPNLMENTPCFVTENGVGDAVFSPVGDLAATFGERFPRVIFLSGCHTGELANDGAVPSMAQQVVVAGADVVLGWARPVYNRTGILAAQVLYQALATGNTVEQAVRSTVRAMVEPGLDGLPRCSDWHLGVGDLRYEASGNRHIPKFEIVK